MSPHQTARHHFDRQIVYARPVFILLALLAVLEQPPSHELRPSVSFLVAYLVVSLFVTQLERLLRKRSWHLPLVCDLFALGYFIYISPSTVPVWFPFMFICYAGGIRWGVALTVPLAGALSLVMVLRTAGRGEIDWSGLVQSAGHGSARKFFVCTIWMRQFAGTPSTNRVPVSAGTAETAG